MKPHGTTARYHQHCRCQECRDAVNRYNVQRTRARKAGDWQGFVPSEKARVHLLQFKNLQAVADVLEVKRVNLWRIRSGRLAQIFAATEKRILSVTPEIVIERRPFVMSDGVRIPAKKTRTLVKELRRQGYTKDRIAEMAGLSPNTLIRRRGNVFASTAMKIEKLHALVMAGEKPLSTDHGKWNREAA